MPRPLIDLTGRKFGRLTVVSRAPNRKLPSGGSTRMWNCVCACDGHTTKVVHGTNLASGCTTSCGCLNKQNLLLRTIKHGHTAGPQKSKTYRAWLGMKSRCTKPKAKSFAEYGGRGIKVCDRWLENFDNFLADLGEAPRETSLDRKEVNGNYEPNNCRWATATQQARNKRRTPMLTIGGETLSLMEWSERSGILAKTIRYRLRNGWAVAKAVFEPIKIRQVN